MNPFLVDPDFTLYVGDVREVLATLPDESVHCIVTSPPYWGLRDYGTGLWDGGSESCDHVKASARAPHERKSSTLEGGTDTIRIQEEANVYRESCGKCGAQRVDSQLGMEPTAELYVQHLVAVFHELRRVLRADGTCWLNLGDSYNANTGAGFDTNWDGDKNGRKRAGAVDKRARWGRPKNLAGIPWRVAFALQDDGWNLRSEVIWAKPNPMPESVTDRPTRAHEQVFLLTRSRRYFYDQDGVRERYSEPGREWWNETRTEPGNPDRNDGGGVQSRPARGPDGRKSGHVVGREGSLQHRDGERWPNPLGRNMRSVWEIPTEPFADAHFATFPQALVERCMKAGTSEHGCCPECHAPWERVTASTYDAKGRTTNGPRSTERKHETEGFAQRLEKRTVSLGWRPTCEHERAAVPCVVLDPFIGSGTTALVARRLGRCCIGIELNERYAATIAAPRLAQLSLLAEASQ